MSCSKVPVLRDCCRGCGKMNLDPGAVGDLAFAHENKVAGVSLSPVTNFVVFRKSLLVLSLFFFVASTVMDVLRGTTTAEAGLHDSTAFANASWSATIPKGCTDLCASFQEAAAASGQARSSLSAASASASCLNVCLSAGSDFKLPGDSGKNGTGSVTLPCSVNASVAAAGTDADYAVSCSLSGGRASSEPTQLKVQLEVVAQNRARVSACCLLVSLALVCSALRAWRDEEVSGRRMKLSWLIAIGRPFLISFLPWYWMCGVDDAVRAGTMYKVSPAAAVMAARAAIALPIYRDLGGAILPVIPAAIAGARLLKTLAPAASLWAVLLNCLPPVSFAFNWPLFGLLYHTTGAWWFLLAGLMYSGNVLVYTCCNRRIQEATTPDTAYSAVNKARTWTRVIKYVSYGIMVFGIVAEVRALGIDREERDRDPPVGVWDLLKLTFDYFSGFYISLVAVSDILLKAFALITADAVSAAGKQQHHILVEHIRGPVYIGGKTKTKENKENKEIKEIKEIKEKKTHGGATLKNTELVIQVTSKQGEAAVEGKG